MIIYNHEKELIGIDAKDLNTLGFKNLAELKSEVSDFADLFVKKPGLIHNFQHVHWIDFVLTASDVDTISEVIIKTKDKEYQAELKIDSIYLNDEPSLSAFIVYLNNLQIIGSQTIVEEIIDNEIEEEQEIINSPKIENIEEIETKEEQQVINDNIYNVYNPEIAAKELGLPVDLVEEFIHDFIKQANEFKPKIYNSLKNNDIKNVKMLTHKLKGVSANLRIDDIFELLSSLRTLEEKDEIEKIVNKAYNAIEKLSLNDDEIPMKKIEIKDIEIHDLSDDIFLDKTEDITDTYEINEQIESIEVLYDKETVANELGISYQNFEELFNDFIVEAKSLSGTIHDAILEDNPDAWTIEAIKFKGISSNMHLYDFVAELDKIIQTKDKEITQISINKIDSAIRSISNL